jgi:hypothetical protein
VLEIILIVVLSKKIAAMMKEKGRNPAGYIVLFVLLWFGCEVIGFIIGAVISVSQDPRAFDQGIDLLSYIIGLLGAAVGGTTGYLIASAMPPVRRRDWEVDEDYDDFQRDRHLSHNPEEDWSADRQRRRAD